MEGGAGVESSRARRARLSRAHRPASVACVKTPAFALCLLIATVGQAAAPDVRAPSIVDAALAALGGRPHLESFASWEVAGTGRENLSAEVQGLAPEVPTWRPHEEQVTVDARTSAVAWQRRTPRNDQSLRWRRLIYRPDSSGFVDFVAGYGALRPSPAAEARRRGLIRRIPHLLLLEVASRAQFVDLSERKVAGLLRDQLTAVLDGDTLILTFTRAPVLLHAVEFRRDQPTRGEVAIRWTWENWKKDASLGYVPRGHRIEVDGVIFQQVTYSRFGAPAPDLGARMTANDAGPGMMGSVSMGASPDTGLQATGEVAPGVHVERFGGFTVMAVEFPHFLVAIEAPEVSLGLEAIPPERPAVHPADEFLVRLRARFPARPVRYVVISHHHGDHMGGVAAFAADGATVIVAPGHRAAALRALGGAGAVETVADRRTITDGAQTLEILNVGKNPHTDENLLIWLPRERIAFQGDLFYDDPMGPFPPSGRGRMNRFTAHWLKGHGIEPRAIYGVHNDGASGPKRLAQALTLPE